MKQENHQPNIYVYEDQLNSLYQRLVSQGDLWQQGAAFWWGDENIYHAYADFPRVRPSGIPCPCVFVFSQIDVVLTDASTKAAQIFNDLGNLDRGGMGNVVAIFLALDEQGVLKHRAFVSQQGTLRDARLNYIPSRSELYSRSKGLLETNILENKHVAIIGLGSGGSNIAVELAKAGIGKFTLIDFDHLDLANVARHLGGISNLGRLKTKVVQDAIWEKNPFADILTLEIDVNKERDAFAAAASNVDLIIAATDNNRSRFNINEVAIGLRKCTLFGRATTRASGGDVLRVRPHAGPCYACMFDKGLVQTEEISNINQARENSPAYTSDRELHTMVQVGLSSDIAPISNMITKLALVELSRGLQSGIASLEADLVADFYIWANRREQNFANWHIMGFAFQANTILRWYGVRVERNPQCPVCGGNELEDLDTDFFASEHA